MDLQSYEIEHLEKLRHLGADCAVLLKHKGDFPLDAPGPIALFGSGARQTVKGGTGSGEVNARFSVSIEEGLERAGFTVTTKYWLDTYDALRRAAERDFYASLRAQARAEHKMAALEYMGAIMPEPDYRIPLYGEGDTALYVLSRISGEGSDRRAVAGDILLTETEIRDILALREKYRRFLLVLNVGGVVDLSPVMAVENILLLSQLGTETGDVLADLILGRHEPSGRLTTTWAAWGDYPSIGDFGGRDDTRYKEGVFVGYRYFDSVQKAPLFPFGHGLGYTSFTLKDGSLRCDGEEVSLAVRATNTGKRPGRTVAQLYCTPPGERLPRPWQSLVAFQKTALLRPGETEELTLRFKLRDLAFYDEEAQAWTLEKGTHLLRLGQDSANTKLCGAILLTRESQLLLCRSCCGKPDFEDWAPPMRQREKPPILRTIVLSKKFEPEKVRYKRAAQIDPETEALTDEELMLLGIGAFQKRGGVLSVVGNAGRAVAGAAGETCALPDKGIPALVMADGPAGLRLSREYTVDEKGVHPIGATIPESILALLPPVAGWLMQRLSGPAPKGERHYQYCSAIPIGTAVAQSWDPALAEELGDIVGDEMERFGVHLWLAPALNIHRDIRCGRNFEYFSEDPLLSGTFAAAITRGVQRHPGCGTTIKHFAANDQETDRYNSNSQLSQRALREIYLRGFGICVRESQPLALMTSYNLINGTHTAQRRDLIEDILRAEFGYEGIVMTDWIMAAMQAGKHKYPGPRAGRIAAAGGDLTMPGGKGDLKDMQKAMKKKELTRHQLQINATRIRRLALALTHAGD